jgi:hypothetical protein
MTLRFKTWQRLTGIGCIFAVPAILFLLLQPEVGAWSLPLEIGCYVFLLSLGGVGGLLAILLRAGVAEFHYPEPKTTPAPLLLPRWSRRFLVVVLALGIFAFVNWWVGPVRPLVLSATDIHDYFKSGGFTGDFSRCITARCSTEAFQRYASQQGLQLITDDRLPRNCPEWDHCPEPWWAPPRSYRGAYYSIQQGQARILAYADGILYYNISVW